jgi:putative transposase
VYDRALQLSKFWDKTELWHVYCDPPLNLPQHGFQHAPIIPRKLLANPTRESCDYMADAMWTSHRFRTFNVIDEFIHKELGIEVDTSRPAAGVIRAFHEFVDVRDAPLSICPGQRPANEPRCLGPMGAVQGHRAQSHSTQKAHSEHLSRTIQKDQPNRGAGTHYVFKSLKVVNDITATARCNDTTSFFPMKLLAESRRQVPCQTDLQPLLLIESEIQRVFKLLRPSLLTFGSKSASTV